MYSHWDLFREGANMSESVMPHEPDDASPHTQTLKTNRTEISVRQSYGNCVTDACQPPNGAPTSGFAACAKVSVQLPLDAQVRAVRYYSTADNEDHPNPVQIPPGEGIWASMDLATESTEGGYKYVSSVYHNRSADRVRKVALEVDYLD
jgi:hypothetical protein